jgi:hypothetical protein
VWQVLANCDLSYYNLSVDEPIALPDTCCFGGTELLLLHLQHLTAAASFAVHLLLCVLTLLFEALTATEAD